jgi:hypothetical protein
VVVAVAVAKASVVPVVEPQVQVVRLVEQISLQQVEHNLLVEPVEVTNLEL